ncbi:hypothetical protein ACLB2K_022993 [Fragaria x ananassa]
MNTRGLWDGVDMKKKVKEIEIGALGSNWGYPIKVFVYHKAFPMPALSYKFQATDPLSGQDTDDAAQFISSVCWRGQSNTLIAANSTGNIKILEMV